MHAIEVRDVSKQFRRLGRRRHQAGGDGGSPYPMFIRLTVCAESDVIGHRIAEQESVLRNIPDDFTKLLQRNAPDRMTVDQDFAVAHIIHPE